MWTFEHTEQGSGTAAAVWQVWTDVEAWSVWDEGLEAVRITGPFAAGTTGELTPKGGDPLPFTIVAVREGRGFDDETPVPGAVLRFEHDVREEEGTIAVTHRVVIDGPEADAIGAAMGPMFERGMPEAVAALVRRVETFTTA